MIIKANVMKKKSLFLPFLFSAALLFSLFTQPVQADSAESVRVIKFWDLTDDLIIERANGEQMLIQHHKACSSMSREFPIQIIWRDNKIVQVKVAANEICDVYSFGLFSSELEVVRRIESVNSSIPAHEAEVKWKGGLYRIDYGEGCLYIRDYAGEEAYVYEKSGGLTGATLYLPKARGMCLINSATLLETLDTGASIQEELIKNVRVTAENNQATFSWDAFPENEIWIALLTYSKYPFNPAEFEFSQLPSFRRTRGSNLRVLGLANDQTYYFYLAASNGVDGVTAWKEYVLTPKKTIEAFVNRPDPEEFEITMKETDEAYVLSWPDKSGVSRKYMIELYVDGKRVLFKLIDPTIPEYRVEKSLDWSRSRFRMTVRSIPLKPTGERYFDSIFWRKG